jgi:hypothetical protein
MTDKLIEVSGITPEAHFPKCPPNHPHTQFCETDKLYIPCPNPSIHEILEVCVSVVVCSNKEICTPIGRKLVINGKKQIKVKFSTNDPCQPFHCAHFEVPFCTFIVLGDSKQEVVQICTVVEDIAVKLLDCRCLSVTSIIFICPILKQEPNCPPCPPCSGHSDSCQQHIPYNHCSSHYQSTTKKYHSGSNCSVCGPEEVIMTDRHYYYGK